ncbi:MAG: NlpC/P60 family protein [Chlamydiales bacterium]
MARRFIVQVPVADLRERPEELTPKDYSNNALRLSQLLYNEKCAQITRQGAWIKIFALEQPRYIESRGWESYSGWVHESEVKEVKEFPQSQHVIISPLSTLSFGTYLSAPKPFHTRPIPTSFNRSQLVEDARHFLGAPYLWGGRAACSKDNIASVDCSGLINLLYRAQGIEIPRDTYDQYLKSRPTPILKPGDLIYLSKKERASHVLLKLDETLFMESPETGKAVRLLKKGKDFIEEQGKLYFKDRPDTYQPYFRCFID